MALHKNMAKMILMAALLQLTTTSAFTMQSNAIQFKGATLSVFKTKPLFMAENEVVELVDDDETTTEATKEDDKAVAPFLSQGEISEEAMSMDWKDPKQSRVMIYIILSLIPVLFLIPLMLGSREMIPAEVLPPVPMN